MSKTGKRIAFTQPGQAGPAPAAADEWVRGGSAAPAPANAPGTPAGKMARLTIDVPEDLHARFKAACASERTKMKAEVLRFIEDWTQKHGKS